MKYVAITGFRRYYIFLIIGNIYKHTKVNGVIEAIVAAGATVRYLSPYSPDLNSIEMMWSKVKAYIRKVKAGTKETVEQALAEASDTISHSDIRAWAKECGYSTL